MKTLLKVLMIVAVFAGISACSRTAPIAEINSVVNGSHTQDDIRVAILKAGIERQWIMTEAGPGVINARLNARTHQVDVRIQYTASSYSIKYQSSMNLKASNGKIHTTYNRWVNNLDKEIQLKIASASIK